jgi:Tfp pilus assembly protein PilE
MTKTVKGILAGAVAVVILISVAIGALIVAASYGWKQAVQQGNQAAAMANLRTINGVETVYSKNHAGQFGTLNQLVAEQMLDRRFAGDKPIVDGYEFGLEIRNDRASSWFQMNADPQSSKRGARHYYIDSTSQRIHCNDNQPATAADRLCLSN